MKISKKLVAVLLVVAMLSVSMAVFAQGQSEKKPYIAVVSKGEQHDFWVQVRLGAQAAADQLGVDMTFEGPPSESDVQIQVEQLKSALAKNPVAICLAALNTGSVIDQLEEAKNKNIPVIGFDSGVPDAPAGSIYANASTNNFAAAGLGAQKMFEQIKGKIEMATESDPVTIVVMNQDAAGESLLSRGKGFRDTMIDLIDKQTSLSKADIAVVGNPGFIDPTCPTSGKKVIIDMIVPASSAITDAKASSEAMLSKFEEDNILGVFCSNELTAKGILTATNDGADLPVKYPGLIVIGFDAGASQKAAVRNGYFLGSITQDPYQIGFKAVSLAYDAYKGKPVADVDTGAKFYNKDNMDDDDIKGLLYD